MYNIKIKNSTLKQIKKIMQITSWNVVTIRYNKTYWVSTYYYSDSSTMQVKMTYSEYIQEYDLLFKENK